VHKTTEAKRHKVSLVPKLEIHGAISPLPQYVFVVQCLIKQ